MKKLLALLLVMVMALSLVACGGNANKGETKEVDMSKYPADINEWTEKQLLEYFKEAVPALQSCEDWYQPHVPYWAGYPFDNCAGTWNDDGDIQIECRTFGVNNPDTTAEEIEAWKQQFRDDPNHGYVTEELLLTANSHMAANVIINYEYTTDEDVYDALEAAWNNLVTALNLTPDF